MKEKNGFISTSIIYSFFLVFILLMIAFLMSFINKRYLIDKTNNNLDVPPDVLACTKENTLSECLFKSEYIEYVNPDVSEAFKSENEELASSSFTEESIKEAIRLKGNPDFTTAATTEEGMFAAEDDYGTSYYYRGAENDNYVVFADQVWQIIRINGDESIRMIYKGQWDSKTEKVKGDDHIVLYKYSGGTFTEYHKFHFALNSYSKFIVNMDEYIIEQYEPIVNGTCDEDSYVCDITLNKIQSDYTESYEDLLNKITDEETSGAYERGHIGYMYNRNGNIANYGTHYGNVDYSIVKSLNDSWFQEFFEEKDISYVSSSTIFCGDKDFVGTEFKNLITYYNYAGNNRLISAKTPSLKCKDSGTDASLAKNAATNLSRYSSEGCITYDCNNTDKYGLLDIGKCKDEQKTCRSLGNGALEYPVSLISADEIVMAGGKYGFANLDYYLYSSTPFWTMTLSKTSVSDGAEYFGVNINGTLTEISDKDSTAAIRPVINLKSDILYCSGDGTASNPYIIGNGSCS